MIKVHSTAQEITRLVVLNRILFNSNRILISSGTTKKSESNGGLL